MVKQQARRAEGGAAGIGLAERNTRRSDSIEAFGSVDVYNLGKSRVTIRHANKRSSTRAFVWPGRLSTPESCASPDSKGPNLNSPFVLLPLVILFSISRPLSTCALTIATSAASTHHPFRPHPPSSSHTKHEIPTTIPQTNTA